MIGEVLRTIITELPSAVQEPFKDNYLADYIRNEARDVIRENSPKRFQDYFFKGSAGEGKWVSNKDAWIGVFNREITSGAKSGYYVVYGFPINSNYVRFGIGQSFYEAQKRYGAKNWQGALDSHADLMRLKIPSYAERFSTDQVEFSKHDGQSYYRDGFVYHKMYDVRKLPEETELVEDLAIMLEAYEELFQKGGRNLDETPENKRALKSFEDDEETYQNPRKKKSRQKSPKSADINEKERSASKKSTSNVRPRNADYGEEAKETAKYKCEISTLHETFKRKKDGNYYTEAHHLIPYEQYDFYADKNLSIDRGFNIVSLCPTCHRKIHHGKKKDVRGLLEKLYAVRGEKLLSIYGCCVDTLKGYYEV